MKRMILTVAVYMLGAPSPSAAQTCDSLELLATLPPPESPHATQFPLPEALMPAYRFWQHVYGVLTHDEAILHRAESYALRTFPGSNEPVVYAGDTPFVINYSNVDARDDSRSTQERDYWRIQRGQSEMMPAAFEFWLARREIFDRAISAENAPADVAALGFLESMFTPTARSPADAHGVFQIQPTEGYRQGARIDIAYNDLYDPFRSARFAARKVVGDRKLLISKAEEIGLKEFPDPWPLAVIGYNQGVNSMRRAVDERKTTDVVTVIQTHTGKNWGFAGKNFYVQFRLFADLIAEARRLGCVASDQHQPITWFELPHYVTLADLAGCCGIKEEDLIRYNPGLSDAARASKARLPQAFPLALPHESAEPFKSAYADAKTGPKKYEEQVPIASYRAKKGQTLASIARITGSELYAIITANALAFESANSIRKGMDIKIPNERFIDLASRAEKQRKKPKAFDLYEVRFGGTAAVVENKFGLAAGEIKKWNDVGRSLKRGTVLAIPLYK